MRKAGSPSSQGNPARGIQNCGRMRATTPSNGRGSSTPSLAATRSEGRRRGSRTCFGRRFDAGHGFDWGDYTEKAVKLIVSYSEGADFFQTFDLEERLRDNVPVGLVQKYAKALRGCCYRANALVFGGLEHTWHSQLESMRPYMTYVLGVTGNDLLRLGTWSICEIKCNPAFQYLVDVYFSLEEQAESEFLCSLCQADFPLKTLFRRADRHLVDLALSVKRVRKDFLSFYSEEVLRRRWTR